MYLTLISHELAADRNSPCRSLERTSRARRFNRSGDASAHRKTLVSRRYFTRAAFWSFSPSRETPREPQPEAARRSRRQRGRGWTQCRVRAAPAGAPPGSTAPREPRGLQLLFLHRLPLVAAISTDEFWLHGYLPCALAPASSSPGSI